MYDKFAEQIGDQEVQNHDLGAVYLVVTNMGHKEATLLSFQGILENSDNGIRNFTIDPEGQETNVKLPSSPLLPQMSAVIPLATITFNTEAY